MKIRVNTQELNNAIAIVYPALASRAESSIREHTNSFMYL